MAERIGKKGFPWKNLAGIKAKILESPFSELEELIEELSQKIIGIEKAERLEEVEEDEEEEYEEDGWEPETEYGEEELYDSEETEFPYKDDLLIEKDFTVGTQMPSIPPELEILAVGNNFAPKVNTYEVSTRWGFRKTGNKHIDNAGIAVIESIKHRAEVLKRIGEYFIKELYKYLQNLNNDNRHWYLRPLSMSKVYGPKTKSTISRVVNETTVLLPNGEIEDLKGFFEKSRMPVSSKCIAIELGKLIAEKPIIKNREIAKHIEDKAKNFNHKIKISEEMIRHWRKKYNLI